MAQMCIRRGRTALCRQLLMFSYHLQVKFQNQATDIARTLSAHGM